MRGRAWPERAQGLNRECSPSDPTELRQRAVPSSASVSRWRSRYVAIPDGSDATSPLDCCRGGVTVCLVSSEFRGDHEPRAGLGLILVEEGGERNHVRRKTFRVSAGDQYTLEMVRFIPIWDHFGFSDARRASAVTIHLLGVPVDIVADALRAGLLEVFGRDDDVQAPGLTITSASRKRLPWGRFGSGMNDVSVKERGCS